MNAKATARRGDGFQEDPNVPLLKRTSEQDHYSVAGSIRDDNDHKKRSKNVGAAGSKNVQRRVRRSVAKDSHILRKIKAFSDRLLVIPGVSSSVAPHPPLHHAFNEPSLDTHTQAPRPAPAYDNNIPLWSLTGDKVKLVAATGALLTAERPPIAFTFNLTPEAIDAAKRHPAGFLDSLKRAFDVELKKAFGTPFPYLFAIDISEQGRLHIHGAFLPPVSSIRTDRKIRAAMVAAWGRWEEPGAHKQILFKPLYSDGWIDYLFDRGKQRRVAKTIRGRTYTINQSLRREAEWTYGEVRRIMRAGAISRSG
ncbi:hypothetical protein XI00_01925 [Bradyrhizobium sp. CCBAU 21359]|uniref:hypothetical protein n=1 Tax=Bradyrhizobium sp. CCBAU 21359 TaxID=1325080 RepID=UPI0023058D09|nr:hypothetical protein [Bradyrhizobium sp. CCBAU 21359]MDA9453059.1 hypothetical protein [Bradyrhizobium sp. CCBAU 21359]